MIVLVPAMSVEVDVLQLLLVVDAEDCPDTNGVGITTPAVEISEGFPAVYLSLACVITVSVTTFMLVVVDIVL